MNAQQIPAWACLSCGDTHVDKDDASRCCSPRGVLAWQCQGCMLTYGSRQDAEGCCKNRV